MNPLKKVFYAKIDHELRGCKRVLDLGCGKSSVVERLSGEYYSVGVDAFKPYLDESRQKDIHDEYILSDVMTVDFPEKSFDAVISFQVLEHLTPEDGLELIKKMERWVKKKIIITTPNGFLPQGKYDDNDLQEHKSGWTPSDFRKLGFRVRGFSGLRSIARSESRFLTWLWYLSFPFVWFTPRIAWQLLAMKDVDKNER